MIFSVIIILLFEIFRYWFILIFNDCILLRISFTIVCSVTVCLHWNLEPTPKAIFL